MTKYQSLDQLMANNKGLIKTADAMQEGVSKSVFYDFVKEQSLEQVAHGIYASQDAWVDGMFLIHLRSSQAIFSHDSALFLHDLTDREPVQHTITVKTGYNPSRLTDDGIKVYTIKADLHQLGVIKMTTSFGNKVPVYDMDRTICDLIRSKSSIEIQIFQDAMKSYVRRKDKNLHQLMEYAKALRVEKKLRQFLEVLL